MPADEVLPQPAERRGPATLALDAAGSACSVVAAIGDSVLADERRAMRHGHAEALLPMVDRVMRRAGLLPAMLDIVATTVGPGGFTGLRTGLAAAHGIALATGATPIGITGFEAIIRGIETTPALGAEAASPLLIAIDSRRPDLYVQLFDAAGVPLGDPAACLPADLAAMLSDALAGGRSAPLLIAGDAADRALAALAEQDTVRVAGLVPDSAPDALGVLRAALPRWRASKQAGVLRPLYLRAPDVTVPTGGRPA